MVVTSLLLAWTCSTATKPAVPFLVRLYSREPYQPFRRTKCTKQVSLCSWDCDSHYATSLWYSRYFWWLDFAYWSRSFTIRFASALSKCFVSAATYLWNRLFPYVYKSSFSYDRASDLTLLSSCPCNRLASQSICFAFPSCLLCKVRKSACSCSPLSSCSSSCCPSSYWGSRL